MECGIENITIIPSRGRVVNQGQNFVARVKVAAPKFWDLNECRIFIVESVNCKALLLGINSFNFDLVEGGQSVVVDIPFSANGSRAAGAMLSLRLDAIVGDTHYYKNLLGNDCWDMVNPNPLRCIDVKSINFEIVAE